MFPEILLIDKPLHLIGHEAGSTIIAPVSSPNGYAISITAPNVTLTGLEITNQGPGLYTTGVKINAPNTTLENCTIHDCPVGIAIWSPQNTITNCDFYRCNDEAIVILGTHTALCYGNHIRWCTFTSNCDGIELQYTAHNTVERCQFTNNTHAGIDAITQSNQANVITWCSFSGNKGFGLYLAGSTDTTISDCVFADDPLTLVRSSHNTLLRTQVQHVSLLNGSSLRILHCGTIASELSTPSLSSLSLFNEYSRVGRSRCVAFYQFIQAQFTALRTFYSQAIENQL
jgi:parallel beta-helix repeat protein